MPQVVAIRSSPPVCSARSLSALTGVNSSRQRECVRCYANAVGGLTALTQGVIPALPTADQVDEFLAQYDYVNE